MSEDAAHLAVFISNAGHGIGRATAKNCFPAAKPSELLTSLLENVSTDGTKRMGIRITPADVANAIVDCIDQKQGTITRADFPVSLPTKLLHYAASVGAPFLNRFINAKLTTKRKIGL